MVNAIFLKERRADTLLAIVCTSEVFSDFYDPLMFFHMKSGSEFHEIVNDDRTNISREMQVAPIDGTLLSRRAAL